MQHATAATRTTRPVRIAIGGIALAGDLAVPAEARGLVVFAHGSGSSRFSSRNRYVADVIDRHRLGTLLIDLLTEQEEAIDQRTSHLRFDIALLAERLVAIAGWAQERPDLRTLPIGLFGASTGGGAALLAAARQPDAFRAVVSRGGRPDLAGRALERVTVPTLLIVGGRDEVVIELNEQAMRQMSAPVHLEIIPGATHLFEEPGALERVAALASDWFERHLGR
jgi:putative phosphoribosyl transferase